MKKLLLGVLILVAQPAISHAGCVHLESGTNSIADFWVNTCSVRVAVAWSDQGDCRGGCSTGIGPNDRASISPIKGRYQARECVGKSFMDCH